MVTFRIVLVLTLETFVARSDISMFIVLAGVVVLLPIGPRARPKSPLSRGVLPIGPMTAARAASLVD